MSSLMMFEIFETFETLLMLVLFDTLDILLEVVYELFVAKLFVEVVYVLFNVL